MNICRESGLGSEGRTRRRHMTGLMTIARILCLLYKLQTTSGVVPVPPISTRSFARCSWTKERLQARRRHVPGPMTLVGIPNPSFKVNQPPMGKRARTRPAPSAWMRTITRSNCRAGTTSVKSVSMAGIRSPSSTPISPGTAPCVATA